MTGLGVRLFDTDVATAMSQSPRPSRGATHLSELVLLWLSMYITYDRSAENSLGGNRCRKPIRGLVYSTRVAGGFLPRYV